jgi:hypothetical protein
VREESRGAVHSGCFKGTTQRRDLAISHRDEVCTHKKQITTKKRVYFDVYYFNHTFQYTNMCNSTAKV